MKKKRRNLYSPNAKCIEYIEYLHLDHIKMPQKLESFALDFDRLSLLNLTLNDAIEFKGNTW